MAFVNRKGPLNINLVEMLVKSWEGQGSSALSCSDHRCSSCELLGTNTSRCVWIQAIDGDFTEITPRQKEILACIAIFGHYTIEEEK